jgi:hypothetical protein
VFDQQLLRGHTNLVLVGRLEIGLNLGLGPLVYLIFICAWDWLAEQVSRGSVAASQVCATDLGDLLPLVRVVAP